MPAYPRGVEILLWLLPAAALTVVAMAGVAWWGREGRGEIDRDEAARRLGEALSREPRSRPGYAVDRRAPERASGVALRASTTRPTVVPDLSEGLGEGRGDDEPTVVVHEAAEPPDAPSGGHERHAS